MTRFVRDDGGQAVVLVALAFTGLLLGVGLAVDTGQVFVARRHQQVAADAAAWAAAVRLNAGDTVANALQAARDDATLNGFTTGGLVTVTVTHPPASGSFAGRSNHVEVVITRDVASPFLGGAAGGRTRISVRAVGTAAGFAGQHAILTLDPDDSQAFKISGNGNVTTTGGGIFTNSNHASQAAQKSGNAIVTAPYFKVVGGVQCSGGSGCPIPNTTTGVPQESDPFSGLSEPDTAGLNVYTNTQMSSDTCSPGPNWTCSGGDYVLSPGVYDNGIKVSGNGNVRFQPGTYILRNGGLQVSGNGNLQMSAGASASEGVTFFNTHSNHPSPPGTCEKIQVSGNGTVDLRAPSTGTYAGMFIFQDSECDKEAQWSGNGAVTSVSGTIYIPSAALKVSGNGTAALAMSAQIVAKNIQISGNANITIAFDPSRAYRPKKPALVE